MQPQKRSDAGKGAALKIICNAENRPSEPQNQGETELFEDIRRAYRALESDPENPFYRIALLKARLAWRRLNHGAAHAALQ